MGKHIDDVLTTEVSSLQGCPHYRGVLTTEVSSLQGCPHYRGALTTEVPSLQRCPHYRGVLTTEVSSLQRCPHYRGVLTTGVSSLQMELQWLGIRSPSPSLRAPPTLIYTGSKVICCNTIKPTTHPHSPPRHPVYCTTPDSPNLPIV